MTLYDTQRAAAQIAAQNAVLRQLQDPPGSRPTYASPSKKHATNHPPATKPRLSYRTRQQGATAAFAEIERISNGLAREVGWGFPLNGTSRMQETKCPWLRGSDLISALQTKPADAGDRAPPKRLCREKACIVTAYI